MSLEREKQGLDLHDYKSKLSNNTYSMRLGKEVPEGDVNLAYIHVPKVQIEENLSLIDTSYTADNVITKDQLESIVVANEAGELEYVDIVNEDEIKPRPPKGVFPSDKINVTRKFKKNEYKTESALYYKFEIDFHYDSKTAIANEKGVFKKEKYTGQQIELTDENGNLLDDSYKYDIYVIPHKENPRIYSIQVYLHKNTDKNNTIKIRYNHIDKIVKDSSIQAVEKSIEFYTDKNNEIQVDKLSRQMLEGGKLRIINGISAFDQKTEEEVRQASIDNPDKEIFAVVSHSNGEGHKVIVAQRSESDPRTPKIFSHRIVAKYKNDDGKEMQVSVGHITDWVMNYDALLTNEKEEYTGEWKNIGLALDGGKINAKDMIELSLPMGTPSVPMDAKYFIEDGKGNLLYNVTTIVDNNEIESQINEVMSHAAEAKVKQLNVKPWKNALQDNVKIKDEPILHRCTIIPERQKTKWGFTWEANGQGFTEKKMDYKTNWQVCADVAFKKERETKVLDVLDKNKWSTIGISNDLSKWQYSYIASMKKNVIQYLENQNDVCGFYQRNEMINGKTINLMEKTDYQFSVKVKMDDSIDDDCIGLMFRVQDAQNYYMFIWEKDEKSTAEKTYTKEHGKDVAGKIQPCDRVILDEYGFTMKTFSPVNNNTWNTTNSREAYLSSGFGRNHKRILKALPSALPPSPNQDSWNSGSRYPTDKTNCSFKDITNKAESYVSKGWVHGKDYKLTVVVTGDWFRIFISDNPESDELGQLVCQARDNTHQKGSYGIFSASQRNTLWYDFKMADVIVDTVCTEKKDILLTDTKDKKLSNYAVEDLMAASIKSKAKQLGDATYEVFTYYGKSDGEFTISIDPRTHFVYGRSNDPITGNVVRSKWTTKQNGLTIKGTGFIEYHADGHYTISTVPSVLPTEQIPSTVKDFTWNEPVLLTGENVSIQLEQPNKLKVIPKVPPIRVIGKPYTLEGNEILKADGLKSIIEIFGDIGVYQFLEIPKDIPLDEICLRIERGKVNGISVDGTASVENAEYRVNYRFRCTKNGFIRLPVDQFQDQIGVNRLRLKSILTDKGELNPSIHVDVVAWTTFQQLSAVPLFAIKVEEQRKIEIEKPRIEQQNIEQENWYIRVKSGRFLKRLRLPYHELNSIERPPEIYITYPQLLGMVKSPNDIVEVDLEYSLPEYTNQEFYNNATILVDKERPMILNEYSIQTRYTPILLSSPKNTSYLEVYSIRGNNKRNLRVADVDAMKGIVYLLDRIGEQDEVYIKYAYKEEWYTYRGFEKNESFFHLDLNPTPGHRHTVAENGFHRWIPIESDTEPFKVKKEGTSNLELLVKQIHVYICPSAVRLVDLANPSLHGKFVTGSVRKKVLFHTDEEFWFNQKDQKYNPTLLRLGKAMLQSNSTSKDNITILDTRTKGGGLDESLSREIIKQVNKESLYHWDIGYFDGEAYQENGVIIIRLPKSILKSEDNPNGFIESEIQEAVAKHKAYGTLPVIEFYNEFKQEDDYNILPNHEFLYNQHIGYYNSSISKGSFEVINAFLGTGDNYALRINNDAEYGITLPGHLINHSTYGIEIKAIKEQMATKRSLGQLEISYDDGTKETIELAQINQPQWMVYKQSIKVKSSVHKIDIILNKSKDIRKGSLLIDYVKLNAMPVISEISTEIYEI
ncbi:MULTISPECIES: hypothetical protein [Bacillus cereus group]|uniref:hypothetical protein n=1 Tax=Bacillus cereus group TaxID=86661 RepID=UPI002158319C|nr:hypothetical protein [Bacillus thuringiensis]WLP67118.1 hypothetical protein Q9G86_28685 [Bacillus thuringiensis]